MGPTKEDWDRFGREIMTGGRSEDVTTERNYENIIKENTKLKQDNQELQKIVEALEMAKQNMPKGTQFVILAEEDFLRNIGIINERNKLGE